MPSSWSKTEDLLFVFCSGGVPFRHPWVHFCLIRVWDSPQHFLPRLLHEPSLLKQKEEEGKEEEEEEEEGGGKTQTESNRTKLRNGSHQRNSIGVSNDTSSLMLKWVQIVQSWFLSSAILFLMAFLCGFSLIVIYHSIEGSILRNQLRLLVFHSSEELMLCETILQDSLVEPISVGSSLISNDSTLNPSS